MGLTVSRDRPAPPGRASRIAGLTAAGPLLVAVLLGVVLLGVVPVVVPGALPPAQAHAVLLRTDPADGAVLPRAPGAVRLVFSEPVTPLGPGLRVFAADGTRVDLGRPPARVDGAADDPARLAVALPDDLRDGGYVAAWRVRSADGHAVAGVLRFTVGRGEPVTVDRAAELAGTEVGRILRTADRTVRGVTLLGLVVAAGSATAAGAVARTPAQRTAAAALVRHAATATLPLLALDLWLRGAVRTGGTAGGPLAALRSDDAALLTAVAQGLGLVLLRLLVARPRTAPVLAAAALALLPLAGEGHQRGRAGTGPPSATLAGLLPGADAVHLAAGAVWVGAVLLLALAVARRTDDPGGTAALADRVGRVALLALGTVAVAGGLQAVLLLDGVRSLTTSAYGATLAAKVALIGLAVGAAVLARRRAARRGGWDAAVGLLRVELALIGTAVLVTGVLVTLPPPAGAGTGDAGMFTASAQLGDGLLLEVGVDAERADLTVLHVYVVEGGALSERPLDVRLQLTALPDGIGPFRIEPLRLEPGHWSAALGPLPPGPWTLEVTVGIDRFTERAVTFTVPRR